MNNKEENIKKLASALADLFIIWMIEIERIQCQTKGIFEDGTFKTRGSRPENPGSN